MPIARFEMPDGRVARFEVPDGTTPEQAQSMISAQMSDLSPKTGGAARPPQSTPAQGAGDAPTPVPWGEIAGGIGDGAKNALAGAVRGAGSIGSSLLWLNGAVAGKDWSREGDAQRRSGMDSGLQQMGADPESATYKTGKIAGEIAGTAGAGNVLANGARLAGAAPSVVAGLGSGGLNVAGLTGLTGLGARALTGAATGAVTAGMVNPEDAGMGAMIGGALPVSAKVVGSGMRSAGAAIRGNVSAEVAALADRAKQLGVQIPADRITNSKPLNALAASLEYIPLSGRAATNERMTSQLNTALSRTFGQNSDNVTQALRTAKGALGSEFDRVLKNNPVSVDQRFVTELADHASQASRELGSDGAKIIQNQIDEIMAKGANGVIDGQASYNIKKTLDRIGKRNSPEAHYAGELKRSLMGAIDRSLGADEAAAFAKTRQQYGNMLTLKGLAKNGADGDISIARLANIKNVNSPDLQELADISAQFLKSRESPHGALQRLVIGSTGLSAGAGLGMLPLAAGTVAAGRATNSLLNSDAARRMVTGGLLNQAPPLMIKRGLLGASKVAPVLTAQ